MARRPPTARCGPASGRAVALGWSPGQVQVVDADLGLSGAQAANRGGFQELVAQVALGRVGLILGLEASRLARSNSDWYQLLDLCGMTDTLIADGDGIYDPAAYSDRLVLGLKGTLSEAELHLLKGRLIAGMRHKAAKGELRVALPAGLEYDQDGRPVVCADEAVREAIATVFRRFAELGSARQVMLSLLADGLELPRRRGGGRVVWAPASYGAVICVLTTPCYAGAFAFGRTRKAGRAGARGPACGRRPVPMPQWEVLICGHHPGYISWEEYLANQERLQANCSAPRGQGGGAVREGRGLLQGIVRCGRCGRMMRTGYQGSRHKHLPRYYCAAEGTYFGRRAYCQGVGGRQIEQAVIGEVLAVLEPAALAATAQALADAEAARAEQLRAFKLAGDRARYEADRARRQYDACEPENRLVARSLEAAWEDKLAAITRAETALAAEQARQHRRTGTGLTFTKARVAEVRRNYHIPPFRAAAEPPCHDGDVVSITKAAAELGVGISTLYRWLADGFIAGEQLTPGAPWRIRLDDALRAKVTEHAPQGWLPLQQAAAALGVARQTVLHKVQRGELAAVHVRRGRRSGLRIQVKPGQAGLFENP